jgi:hypothetical protein
MSLKISELTSYQSDIIRYQSCIDGIVNEQEKIKAQSLLRDYKNLVNKIDTKIENIIYEDTKRVLSSQRQDSIRLHDLRQQLESLSN